MDSTLLLLLVIILSMCWGSFLASLAYRMAFDKPIFTIRSYCTTCLTTISWYDNIPIISWILLKKQCRKCGGNISWIYPFTEAATTITLTLLFHKMFLTLPLTSQEMLALVPSFFIYGLFFSALIANAATDFFAMVMSQAFTIWLVPFGLAASFTSYLAIDHIESIIGSMFGYGLLWGIAFFFKKYTNNDGLGIGDMEQLCMIGAFVGPVGVWITLILGSILGLIIGGVYLYLTKQSKKTHIPFGPFLSTGAISYVLFKAYLVDFFLF